MSVSSAEAQAHPRPSVSDAAANPKKRLGFLKLSKENYHIFLKLELAVLIFVIAVIWALLAIPIFFFALSDAEGDGEAVANISAVLGKTDVMLGLEQSNLTNCSASNCSKDFYCRQTPKGEICAPTCNWKELSDDSSATTDILVALLLGVGIVVGIIVLILAVIRRKRMLTFPSVLIFYHNLTWIFVGMAALISIIFRNQLYCVNDQIDSILNSSPYCVFSGMVFYYGLLQLISWWLCHVIVLFWKISFPLKARTMDKSSRTKYLYIGCILISLLVPLLPVIVTVGFDVNNVGESGIGTIGFTITRFPPLLCTSIASEATFYSLVLPLIITLDIGIALLILMFWFIHKQTASFKINQEQNPLKIGTAEKKLLAIIIYYIILAVFALTTFSLFSSTLPLFFKRLFEYFVCEQYGPNDCDRSGFEDLTNPIPANISFILLALNPWLNLIFAINFKELKAYCKPLQKCAKKHRHNVSVSNQSTASTNGYNGSGYSNQLNSLVRKQD